MTRVAPQGPTNLRAPKVFGLGPGKDAFHRVPLIAGEVRDAVERVLTG